MSSEQHCCVPGCRKNGDKREVLHGFPNPDKERERFNTWLYAIGGDLCTLENERIYKYRRVCQLHFEEKYHCRFNRISNIAVPTLNMPALLHGMKPSLIERKPMQLSNQQSQPHTMASFTYTEREMMDKENTDPEPSVSDMKVAPGIRNYSRKKKDSVVLKQVSISQVPPPELPVSNCAVLEPKQDLQVLLHQQASTSQMPPCPEPSVISSAVLQQRTVGNKSVKKITRPRAFLTKEEKDLHLRLVAAKVKICKMKNKMKKQMAEIKAARKFVRNPDVVKLLENCSSMGKLLMQIQFRENKKKDKGRRFTLKEKIAALSILKHSPRGYRFLRSIFVLPAPQTLVKLIQKAHLRPGINKNIFAQLKKKAEGMDDKEKICVVLFDEISLKAHVAYQENKDRVMGFVDNGDIRSPQFADHAQVFMVRGLLKNYKQVVSYTFSASATKGPELAKQIKEVVSEVQRAGLIVVASVCDQGANNRSAIKMMLDETKGVYLRRGETPKENVILINDKEIIPLYDPPHLLKGIRNNFLTKNVTYMKDGEKKTGKWSHIEQLYKENPGYKGVRLIPKLTENHVKPANKMKVKYATQIFSRTVASNMGYLADKGILPGESKDTADFLLFMDEIFDSVNGSFTKNKYAKPLLGPATPVSVHHITWAEGKRVFESLKFINTSGKEETVPSVKNWLWTLKGIEILLKKLQNEFDVTSVWLRHLNQDPLENFFGSVRSHGCRNINPTCEQFEAAFASLMINDLKSVHSQGKNCEVDLCDALYTLMLDDNAKATPTCDLVDINKLLNINLTPLEQKETDPKKIAPLQYMSGYFLKKIKTHVFKGCAECNADFADVNELEYIKYREYAGRRWLCTPSRDLISTVSNMQDVIDDILKSDLVNNYLKETIKIAMHVLVDFKFIKCKTHKCKSTEYLINIVIRCFIYNRCKDINKILSAKIVDIDHEDTYQVQAKKYAAKCCKRKK